MAFEEASLQLRQKVAGGSRDCKWYTYTTVPWIQVEKLFENFH
jgi:hypothetical protein